MAKSYYYAEDHPTLSSTCIKVIRQERVSVSLRCKEMYMCVCVCVCVLIINVS